MQLIRLHSRQTGLQFSSVQSTCVTSAMTLTSVNNSPKVVMSSSSLWAASVKRRIGVNNLPNVVMSSVYPPVVFRAHHVI